MKKILIINDDIDLRDIYKEIIEECVGYEEIICAQNSSEACTACSIERFDLILLDHSMPNSTGLELLLILRNNIYPNKSTPVIFVSGESAGDFRLSGLENIHYLTRLTNPFNLPIGLLFAVDLEQGDSYGRSKEKRNYSV